MCVYVGSFSGHHVLRDSYIYQLLSFDMSMAFCCLLQRQGLSGKCCKLRSAE